MEFFEYNPLDSKYKSTVGACEAGKLTFSVKVDSSIGVVYLSLLIHLDGQNDQKYNLVKVNSALGQDYYSCTVDLKKGLYWYCFTVTRKGTTAYLGCGGNKNAVLFYCNPSYYQQLVYSNTYIIPSWLNNGVMYHIFVDRFCKSGQVKLREDQLAKEWGTTPNYLAVNGKFANDFYGGDLKGVISKLDYLRSLNVTTIYLSPIFTAYSNHKYDTEDYETIDSAFGDEQDFIDLCQKAQWLGIKVVLDGVFNHSGSSSKYFNKDGKYATVGAYQSTTSPYCDWFNFTNKERTEYDSWWGIKTLPTHNEASPSLQEYFAGDNGIVAKWLKLGASGYRLDVVDEIGDALLDKIVSRAKAVKPDCAIIGEVWEDATNKISYGVRRRYFQGGQLDSVMNYQLKDCIIDFVRNGNSYGLAEFMDELINNYPSFVLNNLMSLISSHDTARAITALYDQVFSGSNKQEVAERILEGERYFSAREKLLLATVLQYTLIGFPSIYYGDEAGLSGYGDPFCRRCFPWGNEDKELVSFYVLLGQLRKLPSFGGIYKLYSVGQGYIAYIRQQEESKVLVIVCVTEATITLDQLYVDYFDKQEVSQTVTCKANAFKILIAK
ncbi:MAG: glycoside hydrolase family 13 protein [Clostridia bacterium]